MSETEKGVYLLENLEYGKYFLKETVAPDGFIIDENVYTFSIEKDGETIEISNTEVGKGFINKPEKGGVEIIKTDISTGQLIPNCGIEILDKDGNVVVQGRTDDKGIVKFDMLRVGDYFYREFDAPDGYILDENSYPFTIKENVEIVKCSMTNTKIPHQPTPYTGDNGSNILAWVMIGLSLAIGSVLFIIRKKKAVKMRNKIIKISAVVLAIALLFGGLFLLFRDDVGEMIQEEKIKPFVPDFTLLELPESSNSEEENNDEIPSEAEEKLKEQTQELCNSIDNSIGWINVPETKINYPVMYSGDNEFYLHRAVDGSYLRVGSIFLDYRCNADFTGKINVLYGHNMSDGSMFADVVKFIDSEYFDSHNYGWLTTENTVYKIDFFSLSQPENYDDFYDVNSDIDLWLDSLRERSFIWRNIGFSENDKFISLSTCTASEGSSRTVLTGKIMEV